MRKLKIDWSFTNIIAFIVIIGCFTFFFWISSPLKDTLNENRNIGEVKTALIAAFMLVLSYYFGNSRNASAKDEQIKELNKTATQVALTTAQNTADVKSEIKDEKATKIAELRKALEDLEPDSEDAKKLLAEIELLEKATT